MQTKIVQKVKKLSELVTLPDAAIYYRVCQDTLRRNVNKLNIKHIAYLYTPRQILNGLAMRTASKIKLYRHNDILPVAKLVKLRSRENKK